MSIYTKDALFTAILSNDTEQIERLRSQGAVLSDEVKSVLSINRLSALHSKEALWAITFDFQCAVRPMSAEDFIGTVRTLREETGETLFFFPAMWTDIKRIMFEDGVWECVLDCFDHKMNKTRTMRDIIKRDRADILAICAKHGWLSQAKKRDEMIEYATANCKTECTAWLLEFKNKNFDLAAERKKAEKNAERELNASPNSVAELKKLWKYEKQEDGTIIITGYKGNRTEVIVPERIGSGAVTAIGEYAFSPNARRLTEEQTVARCRITKVVIPEGVTTIGENAFGGSGVVRGNFNAFSDLSEVVLPSTLDFFTSKASAENAPMIFRGCPRLTVKVPHSPYAEIFCRRNKVDFEFILD